MSLADQFAGAVVARPTNPAGRRCSARGGLLPLDRNAKARIMVLARALMQRTGEGKHYGVLTAKFVAVLGALLWGFHNAAERPMLPELRAHRREGRLRARDGLRGDQRAGGGRHPDLGEPDRAHPGVGARPVRPGAEPLARHPHEQRLFLRRPATARATAGFF